MKQLAAALLSVLVIGCTAKKHNLDTTKDNTSVTASTSTTITEVIDTGITIAGNEVRVTAPLDSLIATGFLHDDNGETSVTVVYDKRTGKIAAKAKAKPKTVPVKLERTINTDKEVSVERVNETHKESSESKPSATAWGFSWLFWMGLILVLIAILVRVARKYIPFL